MLVREDEARQLKREELLTEAKLSRESQRGSNNGKGIMEGESDDNPLDYLWSYQKTEEINPEVLPDSEPDGCESNASEINNSDDLESEITSTPRDGLQRRIEQPPSDDQTDEPPLVGFWAWENSIRVHRMKMHIAKNSDLALHVVLAVVTNQLRSERHAAIVVAM